MAGGTSEGAGDALLLVDPEDVAGLAAAVRQVTGATDLGRILGSEGMCQGCEFRWQHTATQTVALHLRLVNQQLVERM